MVLRVRHTVDGAERIRTIVKGLTPQKGGIGKSKMGITSYIATVLRNGVKFAPRRARGAASIACRSLQYGRATHRLLEKFCKTGALPSRFRRDPVATWVRGISTGLLRAGIEPLRTELPCALGQLRTAVDLLGLRVVDGKPRLVCVEFKTTSLTQKDHTKGYDLVCARRAVLGGLAGSLPNSEREAHRVQCSFGGCALHHTYAELREFPMDLCVIVSSTTGTSCYSPKPLSEAYFRLGATVSSVLVKDVAAREKLSEGRIFPPLPSKKKGGAPVRSLLEKGGHSKIRKSARASCLTTMDGMTFSVGVVDEWAKFDSKTRDKVIAEIRQIAAPNNKALLVTLDPLRGGWRLKYV